MQRKRVGPQVPAGSKPGSDITLFFFFYQCSSSIYSKCSICIHLERLKGEGYHAACFMFSSAQAQFTLCSIFTGGKATMQHELIKAGSKGKNFTRNSIHKAIQQVSYPIKCLPYCLFFTCSSTLPRLPRNEVKAAHLN